MEKVRKLTWLTIFILLTGLMILPVIYAQDDAETRVVEVPGELVSPRSCYETFAGGMESPGRGRSDGLEKALLCLDLSSVPAPAVDAYGEEIAWKLYTILNSLAGIDAETLPENPDGSTGEAVLPEEGETGVPLSNIAVTVYTDPVGAVEIVRDSDGAWRFSADTPGIAARIFWQREAAGDIETENIPRAEAPESIPEELSSPRVCYETCVDALSHVEEDQQQAYSDAAVCFDFSRVAVSEGKSQAGDIPRQFNRIIRVIEPIDTAAISDWYTGPGFVIYRREEGTIEIGFSMDGAWRVTASSVAVIPAIYFAMVESREIEVLEDVEVGQEVPQELATPRRCYLAYYEAMKDWNAGESARIQDAIECLDLSEVPHGIVQEYSHEIARKLGRILDHLPVKVDPETVPDRPSGPRKTIYTDASGIIEIVQGEDGAWRFSAKTVQDIPEIYRAMEVAGTFEESESRNELSGRTVGGGLNVRDWIPSSWKNRSFFLEDWQWLYLILIILIGLLIDRLIPVIIGKFLRIWLKTTFLRDRMDLAGSASRPFGFLGMAAFWWLVLGNSGLDVAVLNVLLTAAKFITAWGIVWCAYRAVDILSEFIQHNAEKTASRMDDLLAPFIRKSLKVFVAVFGVIFVASNIDINVSSLLAGLGIGGIAIALAAKDTLENLFGSVTVLFDRPFQVGDWVVVGDVEGTVEELGFRSTRIRTFYNSVITMPNSRLVSNYVDNYGAREFRRFNTMISVTYDTPPEKIEAFCEGVRQLILAHPYTRKDNFHVWLNAFSASSLDILLYVFFIAPDWATELRERHRLLMDIIRLAHELGIEFAFPTQSIYMAKDKPVPPVFPDDGDIKKSVDASRKTGSDRARKIASSELGGRGVVPPPLEYGDKGSVDDSGDDS